MTQGFIIHTGNILKLADLKRKPGHTPADELHDSLKIQLSKASTEGIKEITAPLELSPLLISDERGSQKITVKLFLSTINSDFIKDSLDAGNVITKLILLCLTYLPICCNSTSRTWCQAGGPFNSFVASRY